MLWLKSLHLIFMVTWFAGLFYLPRLFVYHASSPNKATSDQFQVMEFKLFWGIMTPSGILTILFGLAMLLPHWDTVYATQLWMSIKLALIAVLVVFHVYCGVLLRQFKLERNTHSHTWYRWFNEIPTIPLVAIILLAVLKQPQ